MIDWYTKVLIHNYANFSGRARRSEYWYYILMNVIIFIALIILFGIFSSISDDFEDIFIGLLFICFLVIIIPSLAVIVRRLHDIGKSGTYYFVRFIPIIGPIWLLILLCTEGDKGHNRYGNDPKKPYDEINEIGQESEY